MNVCWSRAIYFNRFSLGCFDAEEMYYKHRMSSTLALSPLLAAFLFSFIIIIIIWNFVLLMMWQQE